MLPTNMMSFMKKMVTQTEQSSNAGSVTPDDGGTTFSKLRQLGSGLMNATGNVTKLSPAKITPVEDIQPKEEILVIEPPKPKPEPGKPASREGACRICLKSFKPEDFSRTCNECHYKVCEDCGYSTKPDSDDPSTWCCSVCKRKMSKGQPLLNDDSTESHLDIPSQPMRRRHSDVKLDSQNDSQMCGLGRGLAPPKNSDAGRRHSDVSPATLKELEKFRKVAGERRGTEELGWEWRSKSRGGSPDRHQSDRTERSDRNERGERKERGRTSSPQRSGKNSSAPDQDGQLDIDDEEERRRRARRGGGTVRRKSRVTRQHSYDDEIKSSGSMGSGGGGGSSSHGGEPGLGVTYQITRRSSAYDVYSATGSGGGGGGALNAMAIAAAQQQMQCSRDTDTMYTKRSSISAQGTREPEEVRPSGRRPSFRAVIPVMPYEMAGDDEKMINLDANSSPDVIPPTQLQRRRGSQLPDISALRGLTSSPGSVKATQPAVTRVAVQDDRELPRQGSLVDGEGIKIVIHDVDSEMISRVNPKRRVVLRRDPQLLDKGHRTRGFGMRVVGGKKSLDGRMYAAIVCTVPGGPAEKAGLQKGDKILEWSGVPLIDRSFEDVAHIIEHTGDVAELVVEHATDIIDLFDDPGMPNTGKNSGNMGLQLESESEKTPSSTKGRRTLPKTPEQMTTKQVSGRVQIHVWYEADRRELVVSLLAADELCTRDDTGLPPQAFAKLVLLPPCGDQSTLQTDVSKSTQNPIWNANLTFSGISGEDLLDRTIEVTLWDCLPDGDTTYLGECSVDLQNAFETDRAVWYRLEDPRGLRSGKSPFCSPRGSISTELAQRLLRRTEIRERSYSDDTPSDSGSPEPYYLHPDHAWQANSRRGSSQSEQLEIEPYELSKDYSRSLPGSRRSSFQSQGGTDSKRGSMGETDVSVAYYNRDRRRSSCTRQPRDHDEIMRSLKAAAKGELGRTMSLSNDKRRGSRRGERKDSIGQSAVGFPERLYDRNSESDEDDKLSQQSTRDENGVEMKLGPGQVVPRGFKLISGVNNGEVKLALFLSKGTLEVEVISARDICPGEREEPDTYVKTYLRDGERWLHKRKTRVIKHSRTPQYRQTLKYGSCDALGRNLLVMLWEKKQGFESNQGLGGAEVDLELLPLTKLTVGWYPLFPIHTLGTQNADSP